MPTGLPLVLGDPVIDVLLPEFKGFASRQPGQLACNNDLGGMHLRMITPHGTGPGFRSDRHQEALHLVGIRALGQGEKLGLRIRGCPGPLCRDQTS
jgi:hypothetical protein